MACAQMVSLNPQGSASYNDYVAYITQQSSLQGQLCVTSHYTSGCGPQCAQMTKNYDGCFSCMTQSETCGTQSDGKDPEPCCPNVQAATQCSNCLGLYSSDALAQCLQTGLSTGAIVGIVLGILGALAIIIAITAVVVKTRKQEEAKRRLGITADNVDAVKLEKDLKNQEIELTSFRNT